MFLFTKQSKTFLYLRIFYKTKKKYVCIIVMDLFLRRDIVNSN